MVIILSGIMSKPARPHLDLEKALARNLNATWIGLMQELGNEGNTYNYIGSPN